MIKEYVHENIDSQIDAISGHYSFHKEGKLTLEDGEVLYAVGSAVIDRSCCGVGGCGFAIVPGYIISWKTRTDGRGRLISDVLPIADESIKKRLTKWIEQNEVVNQVEFW